MTDSTSTGDASSTWPWPPEVPPSHPPVPPAEPSRPWPQQPAQQPAPILPTWEEPEPRSRDRDIADRLLDQRIVLVTGHLDDSLADRVAAQLLLLGNRRDRPIRLRLSCREAELRASLALAAAIDLTPPDVHCTVSGTVPGAALGVLCACAERVAHRHTSFLLSLPREPAAGVASELATRADEHELLVTQLAERAAHVTGRPAQDIAADLRSGRLMDAEGARSYGLVDELV
jgi:ATP-dependent Clp protease protease subunit